MKLSRACLIALVLATPSPYAHAAEPQATTISALRYMTPCRSIASVKIKAYLHVSFHGAWLTQGPNGGKPPGIVVRPAASLTQTSNKQFFGYLYDPYEYQRNSFHATFMGSVTCNVTGAPVLIIKSVGSARVAPVGHVE